MKRFSALALAVLLTLSSAVAKDKKKDPEEIGNRDVGKGVNFYSIEKEIALGKQLAQEVERQAKIVDDPVIAEYVNRVGQNLVRNSDAKVPFTIKVLDAEEINAFALKVTRPMPSLCPAATCSSIRGLSKSPRKRMNWPARWPTKSLMWPRATARAKPPEGSSSIMPAFRSSSWAAGRAMPSARARGWRSRWDS